MARVSFITHPSPLQLGNALNGQILVGKMKSSGSFFNLSLALPKTD